MGNLLVAISSRKNDPPFPSSYQLPIVFKTGWALESSSLVYTRILIGLILCRPYAGKTSYCVFMCSLFFILWLFLHSFYLFFHNNPWDFLSLLKMFHLGKITHNLFFSARWQVRSLYIAKRSFSIQVWENLMSMEMTINVSMAIWWCNHLAK